MATTETRHIEIALLVLVLLAGLNAIAQVGPALPPGSGTQVAPGQIAVFSPLAAGVDFNRIKAIMESHPGQVDLVREIVLVQAHAHGDFVQPCQLDSSVHEETDPNLPRATGTDP